MDSPLFWVLLGLIVAGIIAAGAIVWLRQRPAPEEPKLHYFCPGCGRKLGYRPRQAGGVGTCPRCRKTFIFPRAPQA